MARSHCTGLGAGRETMGYYILCRPVHTAPGSGMGRTSPIVSYCESCSCTCPTPVQCKRAIRHWIGMWEILGSYLRERLFYRFYCNHSMPGSCADSLLAFKAIISFADVQMSPCLGFNSITPKRCQLKRQGSTVGRVVNSSVKFTTAVTSLMRCSLSTFLYFPSESSY